MSPDESRHFSRARRARFECLVVSVSMLAIALGAGGSAQSPVKPGTQTAALERDKAELHGLWLGDRYRLTPGDVLQLTFPFVPEFDQLVSVQPDGYIALRAADDIRIAGRTLPEIKSALVEAYKAVLREPVITLVLKEFEKPYFVAAGEVARPGKYDLLDSTTVSQALAFAGGPTGSAKQSDVLLFRRRGDALEGVTRVNVKEMYRSRNLAEDPLLRPGDTLFVPRSSWSALSPFIPRPGLIFSPFIR